MRLRVYWWLLRLYPSAFRALFADEMVDVFVRCEADARRRDRLAAFYLREYSGLLWGALTTHLTLIQSDEQAMARWVNRVASGVYHGFLVAVTVGGQGGDGALLVVFVLLLALNLSAWRWERRGGWLMVGSAAFGGTVLAGMLVLLVGAIGIIGGVMWALPTMLFGAMFVWLSGQQRRMTLA